MGRRCADGNAERVRSCVDRPRHLGREHHRRRAIHGARPRPLARRAASSRSRRQAASGRPGDRRRAADRGQAGRGDRDRARRAIEGRQPGRGHRAEEGGAAGLPAGDERCRAPGRDPQPAARPLFARPAAREDDVVLVQPLQRAAGQVGHPRDHRRLRGSRAAPLCARPVPRSPRGDGEAPGDAALSRQCR